LRVLASLDDLDRSGELLPEFGGCRTQSAKDRNGEPLRPAADLTGQTFVVFHGNGFRACPGCSTIATVVQAKRPCTAVDLRSIRTSIAE
jgi:hypothetical protein